MRSAEDHRIRTLRPPKLAVDPETPLGTAIDEERRPGDRRERALAVFLAGSECPFTCNFCDLWRRTLDGTTSVGAIPRQIARALDQFGRSGFDRIKLYNASNFFDSHAIPVRDVTQVASLVAEFAAVTVECHARLLGHRCLEFASRLRGRLEVAVGLETIHPTASSRLNKRMSLRDFDRAAGFLRENGLDLRAFVLLGAPFVPRAEAVDWAVASAEYAIARGASLVAIIPVRGGNGELERLQARGEFTSPTLAQLEEAVERCLTLGPGAVIADAWDLDRLASCPSCGPSRADRIRRINASGRFEPRVVCAGCGAG